MVRYANCTEEAGRRAGITDPGRFDPRRWKLPAGSVRTPPVDGYLTFGHGLRICPGKELAHMEAVVCVAHVLRAFSLALPDGHPHVKSHTKFTQRPDREISLLLTPRADR
jgi:cytochrome P450